MKRLECNTCKVIKHESEFNKKADVKSGRQSRCRACQSNASKTYHVENKECIQEKKRKHYQAHKERINLKKQQYKQENKDIVNAGIAKRRAMKLERTPPWVDHEEIKELYTEAKEKEEEIGEVHHVDHIVPLQSDLVCGLHVADNLRVIPATENLSKHNKHDPEGDIHNDGRD